jgi:hypothetical protein
VPSSYRHAHLQLLDPPLAAAPPFLPRGRARVDQIVQTRQCNRSSRRPSLDCRKRAPLGFGRDFHPWSREGERGGVAARLARRQRGEWVKLRLASQAASASFCLSCWSSAIAIELFIEHVHIDPPVIGRHKQPSIGDNGKIEFRMVESHPRTCAVP